MATVTESKYDSQLLSGIRVALSKARELGYLVEHMDVTASLAQGICSVHFAPLAEPGEIIAGGDLSVSVDLNTNEVSDVERGQ